VPSGIAVSRHSFDVGEVVFDALLQNAHTTTQAGMRWDRYFDPADPMALALS
jgi:hypothetical protein